MDISIIKTNPRYKNFQCFERPIAFNELFRDTDYDVVQVHDMMPLDDPVGFVGVFKWKSNALTPLDGDTYNANMPVWGFNVFINKDMQECLDVLSDNW